MERKSFITNIDKTLHEQIELLALNNNLTVNEMIEIIIKYGVDNSKAICRIIKAGQMTAAYRAAHPVARTEPKTTAPEPKQDADKTVSRTIAPAPEPTKAEPKTAKPAASRGKTTTMAKTEVKTTTVPKTEVKTTTVPKTEVKTTTAPKAEAKTTAPRTEARTTADNSNKTISANKLHAGVATFKIPPMPKTTTVNKTTPRK